MFKHLILLLAQGDYYGVSENIDIAKGINKAPNTLKEARNVLKRKVWQLRK